MPDLIKLHNLAGQLAEHRRKADHRTKNRAGGWYEIRNSVQDTTAVYIYDMIGDDMWGGGVSAEGFASQVNAIVTPNIELHLNSEGGEVFDGIAIYEVLKQHEATVGVRVDSLAASAASFIAMAADPYDAEAGTGGVLMARNARMMIHDAAVGGAYGAGNAADLRAFATEVVKLADLLDDMSLNIADIYAQRAGGTVDDWRNLMLAETWFSASQAIDKGLADGIIGEDATAAPAAAEKDEDEPDVAALLDALKGAWNG